MGYFQVPKSDLARVSYTWKNLLIMQNNSIKLVKGYFHLISLFQTLPYLPIRYRLFHIVSAVNIFK